MSDYLHQSGVQVALAALIAIQESFQQISRVITVNTDQRRRINYLRQLLDAPIRRRRTRRVWIRPGRTSLWWDNFVQGEVDDRAWRENFRMSKDSLVALSEELRPYIEGETTNMRAPVGVLKKVACTLYYLSDEGRLMKTANAFGLSRPTLSVIVKMRGEIWRYPHGHLGNGR